MPEANKPVEEKKPVSPAKKMIPESDLIAFKKASLEREKRLKEELATKTNEVAEVNAQLKITKASLEDDEEVAKVRKYLLDEDKRIKAEQERLGKDLASFKEREREVRVQTLATQYSVEIDSIKDADDPEKEALRLVAERLTKEKEEKTPESIFETATPGSVKTQPKDMSDEEFEKHIKGLKQEALSKK